MQFLNVPRVLNFYKEDLLVLKVISQAILSTNQMSLKNVEMVATNVTDVNPSNGVPMKNVAFIRVYKKSMENRLRITDFV